jgi:type I restriction enzyme R subunit
MSAPEARARQLIDRQLEPAGWILQHRNEFNRKAARGVAVREFPLPAGEADYLLLADGKAAGAVEAKKSGTTLSGFAEQSEKYLTQPPEHLDVWADSLLFGYESTGIETQFRDLRDPQPRSRPVFAFHKPDTHIAREVFEQGNEFCRKITYQAAESPKELIKRFRT